MHTQYHGQSPLPFQHCNFTQILSAHLIPSASTWKFSNGPLMTTSKLVAPVMWLWTKIYQISINTEAPSPSLYHAPFPAPPSLISSLATGSQALRIPLVASLASASTLTARGSSPTLPAALAIAGAARTTTSARLGLPRVARRRRRRRGRSATTTTGAGVQLALDERKSLLAILLAVALVDVRVIPCAAVWIRRITIRLDLGG